MANSSEADSREKKIAEALKLLEEVVQEGLVDVQGAINRHYPRLKEKIFGGDGPIKKPCETLKSQASEKFIHVREAGEEKIKEMATKVDSRIHTNPWPFIGTIALLTFLLGLFIGHDE